MVGFIVGCSEVGRPVLGRPVLGRPALGRPALGRPVLGRLVGRFVGLANAWIMKLVTPAASSAVVVAAAAMATVANNSETILMNIVLFDGICILSQYTFIVVIMHGAIWSNLCGILNHQH